MSDTIAPLDWAGERLRQLDVVVRQLLSSPVLVFDERSHRLLPEQQGIYAIYVKSARPGDVLRAGKTRTAASGLRQRIYQNHLMGKQTGNLRSQLVQEGVCKGMEDTKPWIRANCVVQYVVIEGDDMRKWAEYMMLALLQPKYCD